MITVTKEYRTETAHRLWNHAGQCKNIHGHSYVFKISVKGDICLSTGMVLDFQFLKRIIKDIVGYWDHALILHVDDPLVNYMREMEGINLVIFHVMPTAENMANHISDEVRGAGYNVVNVKVYETTTSYAEWRKE